MITHEQCEHIIQELLEIKRQVNINILAMPVLRLDRNTYRALETAMGEYMGARYLTKNHTWFSSKPRLLGFNIEVS